MSEICKIILTVLTGVVIYVIGRIIEIYILRPLQEYKQSVSSVVKVLVFYDDFFSKIEYVGNEKILEEASDNIRGSASELLSKSSRINFYEGFALIKVIPPKPNTEEAVKVLLRISSLIWEQGDLSREINEVKRLLFIKS